MLLEELDLDVLVLEELVGEVTDPVVAVDIEVGN